MYVCISCDRLNLHFSRDFSHLIAIWYVYAGILDDEICTHALLFALLLVSLICQSCQLFLLFVALGNNDKIGLS